MTVQQIASMVASIGYPNAYYAFDEGTSQSCPFVVFFYVDSNDVFADNSNYQRIVLLNIELYTDNKDFEAEAKVEKVLADHGLTYHKEESYVESEKMFQIAYEMEVIING